MTLWPDTVVLDGATIPLAGVLADLMIHHGRTDFADEPTATTCQLTLDGVTKSQVVAFEVGQSLVVTAKDGAGPSTPRFTGTITDARLEEDRLTVIAAGLLSKLRLYPVGDADWPVETWSARVTRVFTEAGLAAKLELQTGPAVQPAAGRPRDRHRRHHNIGRLPRVSGADGRGGCHRPPERQRARAGDRRPRALNTDAELDPADVAYIPAWVQDLPRGNIVTVRYTGDQSQHVTVTDPSSIASTGNARRRSTRRSSPSPTPPTAPTSVSPGRRTRTGTSPRRRLSEGSHLRWARRSCCRGCRTPRRMSRGHRCSRAGTTRSPATHGA